MDAREETKDEREFRVFDKYNLECALPMVAKDMSCYAYNGVYFNKEGTVATDGRIVIEIPFPSIDRDELPLGLSDHDDDVNGDAFIMSQEASKSTVKALPKRTYNKPILQNGTIGIKDNKACIKVTDLETIQEFNVRGLEGDYPDFEQVKWPDEKTWYTVTLSVPILESIVKSAKVATRGSDAPFIAFRFQKPDDDKTCMESIRFSFNIEGDTRKAEGVVMPVCEK